MIVDDEAPSREYVDELLVADGRFKIVARCENGSSAIKAVKDHSIDVVFLDIETPGIDGFGVLDAIQNQFPMVVFVTAFGEQAVRAFEFPVTANANPVNNIGFGIACRDRCSNSSGEEPSCCDWFQLFHSIILGFGMTTTYRIKLCSFLKGWTEEPETTN